MADRLIRAGIVLTGDAAGAVAAFRDIGRETLALRRRFDEAQAEVQRLAAQLKAFQSIGVAPAGLARSLGDARVAVKDLAAQLDAQTAKTDAAKAALAQYGVTAANLKTGLDAALARQRGSLDPIVSGLSQSGRLAQDFGAQMAAAMTQAGRTADEARRKFDQVQASIDAVRNKQGFADRLTAGLSSAGRLAQDFGAQMVAGLSRAGAAADLARERMRALAAAAEAVKAQSDVGLKLTAGLSVAGSGKVNDWDAVSRGMTKAGDAAESARRKAQDLDETAKRGATNFGELGVSIARQLAGLAGVSLGVGAVREVIAVADAYQLVSQRLRLVVRDSAELGTVQRTLFESAQATRLGYLDLADSYARLARNAQQAGFSQQQLLSINETIAKASTISGGSRESIQGSLIQLSQGIASNRLGGDELRSVLEQNSRLAQAIADGLGKSIGELRAMGEEGKLTADVVLGAIANSKSRIDREFAEIRPTAGQGFTVLKNSVSGYVDELNTASDGTNKLAAAQIGLARALDFVTRKNREAREGLAGKQVADSIEAQNTRELARARSNAAPVQASEAFLVIQQRLSGVNREFTKDLNTLFDAYNKGAIPVERYRELVEKLIQTDTEAGKSAKAAAEARLRAQRELLEKGVADQQRLIDATRRAFEQSLADAKKYAADAAKLREDANQVRADAAGRAADRRNASLDPAERDARNGLRAGILIDQSAALSRAAAQASASGDAEAALKLAERAKKLAEDAGRFADKVTDDDRAASLIERAGEAAARAIETAAKVADAQAAQARSVADAQREVLAGLEERLKALQEAAAKIPVKLDTEEAKAAFEALKALFGQGFTVPLRTQAAGAEAPGFAAGGAIAGPGPRGVDSVLMWGAPGEHVLTAAEVAAAGGHAAIYALRAALRAGSMPRYAAGGIVDRVRVHEPALAGTGGGTTINLTLPGVGTFPVQASESVAQDLVRAARKRGRRT